MSAIHVRVKDSTKKSAAKVFAKMGIDMSTGIKLYLHQVILKKGIPFQIVTENGLTTEEEAEILKASEEAERGVNVTKAITWKESKAYLDKLKKSR